MVTGVLKYTGKNVLAKVDETNVRKIYSTIGRMDAWEYSLEIIIVPLKERIAQTNCFWK